MPPLLLSIAVPTFNRADCLDLLLTTLCRELDGLEDRVAVVVGDNASTDRTQIVTASFKDKYPNALILRHETNLGPDENFCRCIESMHSRYFWIIGDDDLPRAGAIRLLVDMLEIEAPDLAYLEGDPRRVLTSNEPDRPVLALDAVALDGMTFAKRIHVHLTFISTMIVGLEHYRSTCNPASLRQYAGSHLVQLGWILPLLKGGRRFIYIKQRCILATQENSGGYSVLKVFGQNFALIVSDAFGSNSKMTKNMIRRYLIQHLPSLVWNTRFGRVGNFEYEDPTSILRPQLRRYLSYWLFINPISRLPRHLAWIVLKITYQVSRQIRIRDRLFAWLFFVEKKV